MTSFAMALVECIFLALWFKGETTAGVGVFFVGTNLPLLQFVVAFEESSLLVPPLRHAPNGFLKPPALACCVKTISKVVYFDVLCWVERTSSNARGGDRAIEEGGKGKGKN
jgi:hypothetical protein